MASNRRILNPLWLAGPDLLIMLGALWVMLTTKYGNPLDSAWVRLHYRIFIPLFIIWLLIMVIHNLFEVNSLRRHHILFFNIVSAAFFSFLVGAVYFYYQPDLLLTPRRTLISLTAISFGGIFIWHLLVRWALRSRLPETYYFFYQNNTDLGFEAELTGHDYLGLKSIQKISNPADLHTIPAESNVIVSNSMLRDQTNSTLVYGLRQRGYSVQTQADFFEMLLRRVPLSGIDESWFFSHIKTNEGKLELFLRRAFDLAIGVLGLIIFAITFPILGLLVKLRSPGPIFFTQERVGQRNTIIRIRKYRTMSHGSQSDNWTLENDSRITKVGKFLRLTHLDELPQFLSLIKGDMSIVGPRPEQVSIVSMLANEIPFYNERHLVKPGITGWAQLNIYAGNLQESKLKLEYDLYYLKHRSILFDLEIVLKTLYNLFINNAR